MNLSAVRTDVNISKHHELNRVEVSSDDDSYLLARPPLLNRALVLQTLIKLPFFHTSGALPLWLADRLRGSTFTLLQTGNNKQLSTELPGLFLLLLLSGEWFVSIQLLLLLCAWEEFSFLFFISVLSETPASQHSPLFFFLSSDIYVPLTKTVAFFFFFLLFADTKIEGKYVYLQGWETTLGALKTNPTLARRL